MNDAERLEAIEEVLDAIGDEPYAVIVVEGAKDTKSLRSLGIKNDILEINSNGGALKTAESVSLTGKKAIILTDWDRKGDEIAKRLSEQFDSLCADYDLSVREKLRIVCIRDIKDVESLDTLYGRLSNAACGGSRLNKY